MWPSVRAETFRRTVRPSSPRSSRHRLGCPAPDDSSGVSELPCASRTPRSIGVDGRIGASSIACSPAHQASALWSAAPSCYAESRVSGHGGRAAPHGLRYALSRPGISMIGPGTCAVMRNETHVAQAKTTRGTVGENSEHRRPHHGGCFERHTIRAVIEEAPQRLSLGALP